MLNSKAKYLIIILALVLISGCVENNIAPNSGNVNVHVYDAYLVPFNECLLTTGKYPMIFPDGNGIASFNNYTFPYDLHIKMYPNAPDFEIYDRINSRDVNIVLPYVNFDSLIEFIIDAAYPETNENQYGVIKFISKNFFWYGNGYIGPNTSETSFNIYLTDKHNKIEGKVIILVYTRDQYMHNIVSYDKFGVKDVKMGEIYEQILTFSTDDLKLNPGEAEFTYRIQIPGNSNHIYSYTYLIFDDYYSESDINLTSSSSTSGNVIVPTGLPIRSKIKLYNSIRTDKYSISKWIKTDPGTPVFLDNSIVPGIFLPIDDAENISDSSSLIYDNDHGRGIYNLNFKEGNNFQALITDKNKITLGELKKAGLNFSPNTVYGWWFEKFSEFNSIDDFLSQPFPLNAKYNSYMSANSRIFRTAP